MIKLIVGSKGSGKTKQLIDLINDTASNSKGSVICIEKGDSLKFDLSHKIRLIDIEDYGITGAPSYYGFIAGLLASNYDITDIFGDATFRILCGKDVKDYDRLAIFVDHLCELLKDREVVVTLTVSCDPSDIPERIRPMMVER